MELTDSLKPRLIETAQSLQGSARRLLMARTVQALGPGGPQRAARALRWGRMTMRTGMPALDRGVLGVDALARRGRQRAAEPLSNLLTDRPAMGDRHRPADPQRRSNRLEPRLTAAEVRCQVIAQTGSLDAARPTAETIFFESPLVVKGATTHRNPPEVRMCRLSNPSRVGSRPPSTSTPH